MSLGQRDTKPNSNEIHEEHHSSLSGADISISVDIARIIYEFRDYDYLVTAKFKTTSSGKLPSSISFLYTWNLMQSVPPLENIKATDLMA